MSNPQPEQLTFIHARRSKKKKADPVPMPPAREFVLYLWSEDVPTTIKMGTPEIHEHMIRILRQSKAGYKIKTGKPATHVAFFWPGKVLGFPFDTLRTDGYYGVIAGLKIVSDNQLKVGQFALSHE